MKRSQQRAPQLPGPEASLGEAPGALKAVQLRLLMKRREELAASLMDLDFRIWALEEFFRSGNPPDPLS